MIDDLTVSMPGEHNVQNATGAVAIAHHLGIGDDAIRAGLAGFGGVKRRFTLTGTWNGVDVFDDYGHHPVEIAAVLKAARSVAGGGHVIAVVQPHRYTRLRDLFDGFCSCFNDADTVIVAPVYAAGEAPIEGVDRDALVEGMRIRGHRDARALPDARGAGADDPATPSGRATRSSASAPARSAPGPMRCRGNWPRRLAALETPHDRGATLVGPDLTRDQLVARLRALRPTFEKEGVTSMALIGSRARGDNRPDSDIDLMIEVDPNRKFSLLDLIGVKHIIEDDIGLPADVMMREGTLSRGSSPSRGLMLFGSFSGVLSRSLSPRRHDDESVGRYAPCWTRRASRISGTTSSREQR